MRHVDRKPGINRRGGPDLATAAVIRQHGIRSTSGAHITLTNSDLTAGRSANTGANEFGRSLAQFFEKQYFEVTLDLVTLSTPSVGIADSSIAASSATFLGGTNHDLGCNLTTGEILTNNVLKATVGARVQGDIACFAVNWPGRLIWVRKNGGQWNGDAAADPTANAGGIDIGVLTDAFAAFTLSATTDRITANFGASAFSQSPPVEYTRLR